MKCPGGKQCIAAEYVCSADTSTENVCTGGLFTENFCKGWKCMPGFMKCADKIHCLKEDIICHSRNTKRPGQCNDKSDQLCDAECAPKDFHGRYVMRRCEENPSKCIPTFWYCDGVADYPDASDEIHCTCEERGLNSCKNGTQCLPWGWSIDNHPSCSKLGRRLDDVQRDTESFEEIYWRFTTVNLSSINDCDNPGCLESPLKYSSANLQYIVDNVASQYVRIHINDIICNALHISQVVDISTGDTNEQKVFSIYSNFVQIFKSSLSFYSSDIFRDNLTVLFERITFHNSKLSFRNVKVCFVSCIFVDTLLSDAVDTEYLRQDSHVQIQVANCTFSCHSCQVTSRSNRILISNSHAVKFVVEESILEGVSVHIYSTHLWFIVTKSTIEPYATTFELETPGFNFVETVIEFSNIECITFQPHLMQLVLVTTKLHMIKVTRK